MNKLIMAAIAALAMTAPAVDKLDPKTSTADDYREVFNELMECDTNKVGTVAESKKFWSISNRKDLDALRMEFDERLANSGRGAPPQMTVWWPKASAVNRTRLGWDVNFPVRLALAKRLNCNALYGGMIWRGVAYEDLIALLAEMSVSPKPVFLSEINIVKGAIRDQAAKIIKRKMREKGISFVVKDGVNPVAVRLKALADALNAPRLSGLNEWNAELGIDAVQVNVMKDISDADVAKLKDAIFYGDKVMNIKSQNTLFFCLGVDGYNKFVKDYNGDK